MMKVMHNFCVTKLQRQIYFIMLKKKQKRNKKETKSKTNIDIPATISCTVDKSIVYHIKWVSFFLIVYFINNKWVSNEWEKLYTKFKKLNNNINIINA